MGFWVFMLIMALLIPIFMIIYSNIYHNRAPKDINGSSGYKTAMSRLNRDTWEFANHYYNRLMRVAGWVLLLLSIAVMLFVQGKNDNVVSSSIVILLVVQLAVMLVCIIPTERALRQTFDENGNRKR